VPTPTPTVLPTEVPTRSDATGSSEEVNGTVAENDKRPMIIGLIVGIVVLVSGFYIVLVEIPYRKKKKAYQKKYGRNK